MLFWRAALDDAPALAAQVASMHAPSNNEDNHERYQALRTLPDDVAPAEFFLLNRFAFSAIMNGTRSTASPQRLTRRLRNATARLRDFYAPLLSVDHAKFEDSIRLHRNDFLYLDPPYYTAGRGFYEVSREVGFNHGALAALLKARNGWLLSYDDCPEVRAIYDGCRFYTPKWSYNLNKSGKSCELLIIP